MSWLRGATFAALMVGACDGEFRFNEPGPRVEDAAVPDVSVEGLDAGDASDVAARAGCATVGCGVAGLRCDVAAERCVACLEDAHCTTPGATRCDRTLGRCVPCTTNAHCDGRQICELTTNRCVFICSAADQTCPTEFEGCSEGIERCVKCLEDVNCSLPARPRCDRNTWDCVECSEDAHCGAPKARCDRVTGSCVGCRSGSDCSPSAPLCDPASFTCVGP